jgi:hypothetical protein
MKIQLILFFYSTFIYSLLNSKKKITMYNLTFYDPVSDEPCNYTNYWTIYNQNTTCFKFIVISLNDSKKDDYIKIMLDHNIAISTFKDYPNVLNQEMKKWIKYNGTYDIITEKKIKKYMKLTSIPTIKNKTIKPSYKSGYLLQNSIYYLNNEIYNSKGFWSKTLSEEDNNYIFTVDEKGNNKLVESNEKRGIRPIIKVKKDLLTFLPETKDISHILSNKSIEFKFKLEKKLYDDKYLYNQLQGFTLTDNEIVFISSNSSNREKSVIYIYEGKNFQKLKIHKYLKTGHGNGMTYNTKTKTLFTVGCDEYKTIKEYSPENLKHLNSYPTSEGYPKLNGISYDKNNDMYVGYSGRKGYYMDSKFNIKYSFDILMFETAQDIEIYNGYGFMITSELGIGKYQSYSFNLIGSSVIYVYDLRLIDGKPINTFGKIIGKIYTAPRGELEDIAFKNNKAFLGYSTRKLENNYVYRFYAIDFKDLISGIL